MSKPARLVASLRVAVALAPLLLMTPAARGDVIAYKFAGVGYAKPTEAQSWGFDPPPADVPIPFSGTFRYDPKLPALAGSLPGYAGYGYDGSATPGPGAPAFDVHLEFGGKTVFDGSNAGPGGLIVYYAPPIADTGDGNGVPGFQGIILSSSPSKDPSTNFSLYLDSSATSLLTSTDLEALPDLGPVLGAGGSGTIDFFSPDAVPDAAGAYGNLTSLERQSVPEPSALAVLAAGALGLVARRARGSRLKIGGV